MPRHLYNENSMLVKKRDGRLVEFDKLLINRAITNALKSVSIEDINFANSTTDIIAEELSSLELLSIDKIQTVVENTLMKSQYPDAARHYIEYRHQRDTVRDCASDFTKQILGLMNQDSSLMSDNANKDAKVIPTQRDLVAGIVSTHFAKYFYPPELIKAHDDGLIYLHDKDYSPFFPSYNCMLIDVDGMLKNGFRMGNADIETPRGILTAAAVTAQIIAQVSSHIYGGNTVNRIDEVLAPYVRMSYDKHMADAVNWNISNGQEFAMSKTRKDVYDACQGLEYEIQTLHTANGQTPFCTFGFGLGSSWEAVLVQESMLNVRLAGIGKNGITPVFPKLVLTLKDGHNLHPQDPHYNIKQLALRCASKRMYPDIVSYDQVVAITGSFKAPMGCRSFLHKWENELGAEEHDGRNNLGVVTLNLPRIALDSNTDHSTFFKILDERMRLVRDALLVRANRFVGVKANVAPILYMEGACGRKLKANDDITDMFSDGRASISVGYIGLHEVSEIMFPNSPHVFNNPEKTQFLITILKRMQCLAEEWKKSTGFAFSLYATPSESLCHKLVKLDRKHYNHPVLEKSYYTNSFHLSVDFPVNPYDKIDFEKQFIPYSTGGFISYGEYPNIQHNLEALEDVWNYAYYNTPYYGTNTPVDLCFECGYSGEMTPKSKGYECPKCNNSDQSRMNVIRRICGYIGNINLRPVNDGKAEEMRDRIKHISSI